MCPILGGNWNNAANAGVWALALSGVRGNSSSSVGLRADSAKLQNSIEYSRAKGDDFLLAIAKSVYPVFFSSLYFLIAFKNSENQHRVLS